MKLEQQVTSLELSKKLKEFGVKQESLFYWVKPWDCNYQFTGDEFEPEAMTFIEYVEMEKAIICSAFTASELGELLPRELEYQYSEIGKRLVYLSIGKTILQEKWFVHYIDPPNNYVRYLTNDYSEANARAQMLIYLLENSLIAL